MWGKRAGVPVVKRERGADPASVCYDVLDERDRSQANLVLIDTAGRLTPRLTSCVSLPRWVRVTRNVPSRALLVL